MSLAKRLAAVVPQRSNVGCVTCEWYNALPDEDRAAFDAWIADGRSIAQLYEIVSSDETNPLPVTDTPFRAHLRKHHQQ